MAVHLHEEDLPEGVLAPGPVAVDTESHFIAGATVATGPSNDSPQFRPAMAQ